MFVAAFLGAAVMAGVARAQVTATGTMGVTNPTAAITGTPINQTSYARLLSVNSIDDFCIFAPPVPGVTIGDSETEEVAWCVQPRNNARVIPDGTLTAVHFITTPLYVQLVGWGDLTKLNIAAGDEGGELDPHGATGDGNPQGGNVTSNVTGKDVSYQEWMNYVSSNQFCIRVCIAENSTYSAALECQHTLDEMGCEWVMPGDYTNNSFTSCEGDSAYPPGIYPLANGSTSTFAQRYTGTYTVGSTSVGTYTVGETVTPSTPYSIPASSNCVTYSSVGNGIASLASGVTGSTGAVSASTTASTSGSTSGASSKAASGASGSSGSAATASSTASASTSKSSAMSAHAGVNYGGAIACLFSFVALFAGVGAVLL